MLICRSPLVSVRKTPKVPEPVPWNTPPAIPVQAEKLLAADPANRNYRSLHAMAFVGLGQHERAELEEQRIEPGRWWAAMREWGEREPARAVYAEELARLYGAYRDALRAIDRRDHI